MERHSVEHKKVPLLFWFSRVFLKRGGEKRRDDCDISNKLADRKSPYENRFAIPFGGPVIPFGAGFFDPISTTVESRLHHFGTKVRPGISSDTL